MLHVYGASVVGAWHVKASVPCQDAHASWVSDDGALAAAVASDGLGSERFSDIGSKIASQAAVAYCRDHAVAGASPEEMLKVLRGAYQAASDAVCDKADEMEEPAGEFDETLVMALLDGDKLFWGQSGDSGLVAGMADGTYRLVTTQQRDEEGRVFPLCFDDHWEFGVLEGVSTVLLCTDGLLDGVFAPPILAANAGCPINRAMARMFLHPQPDDAEHLDEVERQLAAYLEACPPEVTDDDKTVVVIFGDEPPASQPDDYYAEPNWEEVRRRARKHLYAPSEPTPTASPEPRAGEGDPTGGAPTKGGEKNPGARKSPGAKNAGEKDSTAPRVICRMGGVVSSSLRDPATGLGRAAGATIEAGMLIGRGCAEAAGEVARAVERALAEREARPPAPPRA